MEFFSTFMPHWNLAVKVSGGTRALLYQYGEIRHRENYVFAAMLKVPNGLRYMVGSSREVPTVVSMTDACLKSGEFAIRPYVLGQDADGCSNDCLVSLIRDCCEHFKIDIVDLLRRTYPKCDTWLARFECFLACKRDMAEWQGTQFPLEWTDDALIGLALSLCNHGRQKLMCALLDVIGKH